MHNIQIFLSADNNYAPFLATTIAIICDNTKSFCNFYDEFDKYVINATLNTELKRKCLWLI